jgi:hypothetical protein
MNDDNPPQLPHETFGGSTPKDATRASIILALCQPMFLVLAFLPYQLGAIKAVHEWHKVAMLTILALLDVFVMVLLSWYFACRKYGTTATVGLRFRRVSANAFVRIIGVVLFLLVFDLVISEHIVAKPAMAVWRMVPPYGAIAFSALAIVQPIGVVLFYQGLLYGSYSWFDRQKAFIVTVVTYALLQWLGRGHPIALIPPAIEATCYTYLMSRYNSVVAPLLAMYLFRVSLVAILAYCLMNGIPV